MKNYIIILACSMLLIQPSFAGLFGPSNYDECVLDGIKSAKTDSAIQLLHRVCENKFPSNKNQSTLVKDCTVTWSNNQFIKGKPYVMSNYVGIAFTNSTSVAYLPANMDKTVIQNTNTTNLRQINRICPDIKLN